MININLSNMVGDSSLSQSKSVSSDSLSTFKDFISEFKLEDENSGTNTNNKEDVDESLILYNLININFIDRVIIIKYLSYSLAYRQPWDKFILCIFKYNLLFL